MNPNSNEAAGQQQPTSIPEGAYIPPAPMPGEAGYLPPEGQPAAPELSPFPAAQPAMPLPPMPGQVGQPITLPQAQPVPGSDVSATTNSGLAGIIDDGDLIEKEWVHKAKAIVDRNRDDPFKQSEELTEVKAEYMKQRYDKNIKLNK